MVGEMLVTVGLATAESIVMLVETTLVFLYEMLAVVVAVLHGGATISMSPVVLVSTSALLPQ